MKEAYKDQDLRPSDLRFWNGREMITNIQYDQVLQANDLWYVRVGGEWFSTPYCMRRLPIDTKSGPVYEGDILSISATKEEMSEGIACYYGIPQSTRTNSCYILKTASFVLPLHTFSDREVLVVGNIMQSLDSFSDRLFCYEMFKSASKLINEHPLVPDVPPILCGLNEELVQLKKQLHDAEAKIAASSRTLAEISSTRQSIKMMDQRIADLRATNARLEQTVEKERNESIRLQKERDSLQSSSLAESKQRLELQMYLMQAQKEVEEAKGTISEYKEKETKFSLLEQQVTRLQNEKESCELTISRLQEENQQLTQTTNELNEKNKLLTTENNTLNSVKIEQQDETVRLRDEVSGLRLQNREQTQSLCAASAEAEQLRSQLDTLKTQAASDAEQISQSTTALQAAQKEAAALRREKLDLNTKLSEANLMLEDACGQSDALHENLSLLLSQNKRLLKAVSSIQDKVRTISHMRAEEQKTRFQMEKTLSAQKDSIHSLKGELDRAEELLRSKQNTPPQNPEPDTRQIASSEMYRSLVSACSALCHEISGLEDRLAAWPSPIHECGPERSNSRCTKEQNSILEYPPALVYPSLIRKPKKKRPSKNASSSKQEGRRETKQEEPLVSGNIQSSAPACAEPNPLTDPSSGTAPSRKRKKRRKKKSNNRSSSQEQACSPTASEQSQSAQQKEPSSASPSSPGCDNRRRPDTNSDKGKPAPSTEETSLTSARNQPGKKQGRPAASEAIEQNDTCQAPAEEAKGTSGKKRNRKKRGKPQEIQELREPVQPPAAKGSQGRQQAAGLLSDETVSSLLDCLSSDSEPVETETYSASSRDGRCLDFYITMCRSKDALYWGGSVAVDRSSNETVSSAFFSHKAPVQCLLRSVTEAMKGCGWPSAISFHTTEKHIWLPFEGGLLETWKSNDWYKDAEKKCAVTKADKWMWLEKSLDGCETQWTLYPRNETQGTLHDVLLMTANKAGLTCSE